jgi:hypothetical protein
MRSQPAGGVSVAGPVRRDAQRGAGRIMSIFEVTPQERAIWELRRAIQKAAEYVDGAAVVEIPISAWQR